VTDIFVLDATSASTIASVEGYDALTAGGRKVVVTQQILAEIRDPKTPQIYKDRFNAWYGSNQASIINVTGELNPEDIAKYNPAGKARQAGDISIRKFLDAQASSGDYFVIVSDDKDLRTLKGPHYRATQSTTGLIAEAIGDKRISVERAKELSIAMEASPRFSNNITPDHRWSFSATEIDAFYENDFTPPGQFSKAARLGFTTVALGVGSTILHKLGIVGDILTFGTTAANAAVLRSENKLSEANKLWSEYIFDIAGGLIVVTVTGAITPKLTSPSPCSPHRAARH
jgi:hypothetical protein